MATPRGTEHPADAAARRRTLLAFADGDRRRRAAIADRLDAISQQIRNGTASVLVESHAVRLVQLARPLDT